MPSANIPRDAGSGVGGATSKYASAVPPAVGVATTARSPLLLIASIVLTLYPGANVLKTSFRVPVPVL